MSSLVQFVRLLVDEGEVLLKERPYPSAKQRADAVAFLAEAFADYRLAVAGPLIEFDETTAVAASELLWQACWFLVSRTDPATELEKLLTMPAQPASASEHLSADLTLRYLPQIHRRARALAPDDKLTELLATVLRQWPLTGALADVLEEPLTPLEFDKHPGLMLLYAERLAENEKPAWRPQGKPFEYLELVLRERGKERSVHLQARGSLASQKEGDRFDE